MAKSSTSDISLLDELRTGGYESSLITTYNIYLPFYEEVVLRKLLASGCRHNVVLADHGQCAQAVRDTNYRPGTAGTQYTLVPMRVPGAFHPKITFLAGPKKILILVGSHNLTVSGFSYNRELSNRIEVLKGCEPDSLRLAGEVWRTLSDWLHNQKEYLPDEIIKAALSVRESANWLKTDGKPSDTPFFASAPGRASLWEQVKPSLKQRAKRIAIVGPFFDEDFSFVRQIAQDMKTTKIVIGIEPDTVSLGKISRLEKIATLVDAGFLNKRKDMKTGYLHAKALFMELKSGDYVLATGSANPGFSAWLRPKLTGNAEAIVLHSGKRAKDLAARLGLERLFETSPLGKDKLKEIETRSAARRKVEQPTIEPLAVAVETSGGFRVRAKCIDGKIREARLLDNARHDVLTVKKLTQADGYMIITVTDRETRSKTHEIELALASGPATLLLVHHTEEIRLLSQSSQQMQFRTALASLGGDYPDLAMLISIVGKIIFDDKAELTPPPRSTGLKTGKPVKPAQRPVSLGVDLGEMASRSKSHRLIRSGDLAYLLDALIHRLGIGLESQSEQVDRQGRSEEEQCDQDDDSTDYAPEALTDYELASICRRKVHTLVARMVQQLEQASTTDSDPALILVQLVAVLATLRELRALENHPRWNRLREELVSVDDSYALLWWAIAYVYGPKHCLMDRALKNMASNTLPDEVSRLPGLLLWLAWDNGVCLDDSRVFGEYPEDARRRIAEKAMLIALAPPASQDAIALAEAQGSVLRTAKPNQQASATEWLDRYISWGRLLSQRIAHFKSLPKKAGRPEPGDLAYATYVTNPILCVVSSSTEKYVGLVDLSCENDEIRYMADKVASIQL